MLNSNEKYDGECQYFFENNGLRYCHLRNPIQYQENNENEYVYSNPHTNTAVIQRPNGLNKITL